MLEERGGAPLHYLIAAVAAHSGGGLTALRLSLRALRAREHPGSSRYLLARLAGRGPALDHDRARLGELGAPLPRRLRADVQPLPLHERALVPRAALGARPRAARGASRSGALVAVRVHREPSLRRARARLAGRFTSCSFGAGSGLRSPRSPRSASLGIPFWLADLRLANRFDVGVAGSGQREARRAAPGAPLPEGRRRRLHRGLVGPARADPAARRVRRAGALAPEPRGRDPRRVRDRRRRRSRCSLARLGSRRVARDAAPHLRAPVLHAPARDRTLLTRASATDAGVAAVALASLVVAEVGWAYEKTPQLFTGDPSARVARARRRLRGGSRRRAAAERHLLRLRAALPRGLEARPRRRAHRHPARRLEARGGAPRRATAGRSAAASGSSTPTTRTTARASAASRSRSGCPHPPRDYEARVFGPYLVLRTREPTRTPAAVPRPTPPR